MKRNHVLQKLVRFANMKTQLTRGLTASVMLLKSKGTAQIDIITPYKQSHKSRTVVLALAVVNTGSSSRKQCAHQAVVSVVRLEKAEKTKTVRTSGVARTYRDVAYTHLEIN